MKKIVIIITLVIILAIGFVVAKKYNRTRICETETNTYRKTLQNGSDVMKYSQTQIEQYAKQNFDDCMGGYKQYRPTK